MQRVLFAIAIVMLAGSSSRGQSPTFSSRVEAVRVDVLVTERGEFVRGLTAADFEVVDNGVAQKVDFVTFEELPVNVVLALDMSDSVAGQRLEHLRAAGTALLDQLAPDDQTALITFSQLVALRAALTKERRPVQAALAIASGFGETALIDATYAGIVVGESDVGRSLLIVFSDGVDTSSWLAEDAVLDAAQRSDVVIYCVSTGQPRRQPFTSRLTALTGGDLLEIESTTSLSATFLRILDEFRHRYLISYTPRGVARSRWHRLDVRVKGRRATVRARPGYLGN
jgi:VWFA-related protein